MLVDEDDRSSLTEVETVLRLMSLQGEKTVIVATHRIGVLEKCDTVFLLDFGKVMGSGSHQALLSSSLLYAKMCSL